jgi:hypothetical protein
MLEALRDLGGYARPRRGRRKLRLFACACVRQAWDGLPDPRSRRAVEAAEAHADGALGRRGLRAACLAAGAAVSNEPPRSRQWAALAAAVAAAPHIWEAADGAASDCLGPVEHLTRTPWREVAAAQADLLREVVGNPYRPAAADPAWLAWGGGTVGKLARAAYQERQLPGGALDGSRLQVLADALEEAGCGDAALLGHLRGPGPHVRGCWAVDVVRPAD